MKDPKAVIRDLQNVYDMRFRLATHSNGQQEYYCTPGMLYQMKKTVHEAILVIDNLALERDSLLDLLEENNAGQ